VAQAHGVERADFGEEGGGSDAWVPHVSERERGHGRVANAGLSAVRGRPAGLAERREAVRDGPWECGKVDWAERGKRAVGQNALGW
jgi:hypothetical protein